MKNFRKVLALILVVATLFSFVAMASAKTTADYADASDVKYVEAVDVLSSIGILKGYDGKYHPNDTIDRDEMAKMIAVLRNGGEDNSALFSGANTFADVKGSWAEGYIAYAAQVGIVNGRNATTFDPDGKVTGVEVMKMLLCVLGYDAKEQGYVGANWQVNVLRDATKMGLMAGMADFDAYAAATRDEAAQLMLNALNANLVVGYVSENIVNITNSLYVHCVNADGDLVAGDIHWTDISVNDAEKGGWEFAYCNAVISNVPLWTIIPGLDVVYAEDCYDRPGHRWTLRDTSNQKVLWSELYLNTPDYVQTAGSANAVADAAKDLYDVRNDAYWTVSVDGQDATVATATGTIALAEYAWNTLAAGLNAQQAAVLTTWNQGFGNGVRVELYDMGGWGRAVVVNTYIAEVQNVSKYYNHFTLGSRDNTGAYIVRGTFRLDDYEVSNGDIVLAWFCDGTLEGSDANWRNGVVGGDLTGIALHDMKQAPKVNVDVDAGIIYNKSFSDSSVTVADKTYAYAANFGTVIDEESDEAALRMADIVNSGKNYDLYLDEYGYIMWYASTASTTTYYAYAVEGTYKTHNHGTKLDVNGNTVAWVERTVDVVKFGADGELTVENIAVDTSFEDVLTVSGALKKTGALVKVVDDDLDYVLTDVAGNPDEEAIDVDRYMDGTFAPVGTRLNSKSYKLNDAAGIYCTSKTIFMIRTMNLDGSYTYKQVTGYENLDQDYVAYRYDDGRTNIQYFIDPNHTDFATYVFIDAKYTTTAADHFIVLGKSDYDGFQSDLINLFPHDYAAFDALVDGERAVILVDDVAAEGTTAVGGAYGDFVDVESTLELHPGKMYTDILVYLGVKVRTANGEVPVYAAVREDTPAEIDLINYVYTVVDGEVYISWTDNNNRVVRKAAADCKYFTITANWNADAGQWDLDVVDSIIDLEGTFPNTFFPTDLNTNVPGIEGVECWGYVYMNADGDVTELYQVAEDFANNFWNQEDFNN